MNFQPSSLGDVASVYGSDSMNYAAQTMFHQWRTGRDVGDPYGFLPGMDMAMFSATTAAKTAADEKVKEDKKKESSSLGFLPVAGAIGGVAAGLVAPIAGMIHEGKQAKRAREHEVTMSRQARKTMDKQAELMLAQAQLASAEADAAHAQSRGTVAMASWLGGALMLVGLSGVGLFAATKAKERRSQ